MPPDGTLLVTAVHFKRCKKRVGNGINRIYMEMSRTARLPFYTTRICTHLMCRKLHCTSSNCTIISTSDSPVYTFISIYPTNLCHCETGWHQTTPALHNCSVPVLEAESGIVWYQPRRHPRGVSVLVPDLEVVSAVVEVQIRNVHCLLVWSPIGVDEQEMRRIREVMPGRA